LARALIDKSAMKDQLPIDAALPALIAAMRAAGCAVLQAPPGAGKTTRVPLALLEAGIGGAVGGGGANGDGGADRGGGAHGKGGKILMLEPRRLATRAAAERMAQSLGEKPGETVGYRMRGASKSGPTTRIEVVTEGILTRMIQSDPELRGISTVIFDEFHERSLNGDLGLALTWEIRSALREDLNIIVMSATLDAEPVAAMLGNAPVITSEGRAYPVETRWLDKPIAIRSATSGPRAPRYEAVMADLIARAVEEAEGSLLAFLPGEGEIRRVETALKGRLPKDCAVHPLFGAMDFAAQRAAIAPAIRGRKIVLATSIAETSLTIEGVRIVVDGGRARRARFDPASGMSRLITERVTKAEAEQRRGRAGRVCEGVCYRLWTRGEEGGLHPFPPAEIEARDLTSLVLELALWGTSSTRDLALMTQPNPGAWGEAQTLLQDLGALDDKARITAHGRALAALPLHPRLAHMLALAGPDAAPLAALLGERDPLPRNAPSDLSLRLEAINDPSGFAQRRAYTLHRPTIERIKEEAKRLRKATKPTSAAYSPAEMAALAYPDRIGLRRAGEAPRFLLSGGKGAIMDEGDPLASHRLIVATDLDGDAREARIRQAIEIPEASLRALFPDQIAWHDLCLWSKRERRVIARRQERLGAITLDDRHWKDAPSEALAKGALEGLREIGLPISDAAHRFRARVMLMRKGQSQADPLPDMSDDALLASLEDWLLPHIGKARTDAQLRALDIAPALRAMLSYDQMHALDQSVPAHFTSPMGRKIAIDYAGDHPEITARIQEMFGTKVHPTVGPARTPLRITLTSPGQRPVQTTLDLPGFWASSYADVRKDMRGRYPRHPWPEDPTQAAPTLRAKPRK
jgi:ATP-dependent helicase HrpB